MAALKLFRVGSFILVLTTFFFGSKKDQPDFLSDLLLYNAVPLSLLILSAFALKSEDLRTRITFELALLFWFAGSVLSSLTAVYFLGQNLQVISDFLYLLFYPLIFIAVPRLIRASISSTILENIDAAIVALGVSALASALLMKPVLPNYSGDQLATFFAIVFPVADIVLIALVISLNPFHQFIWRNSILTFGIFAFAAADFINLWLSTNGNYSFGSWTDSLWLVALLLIVESLWHKRDDSDSRLPTHPILIAVAVLFSTVLLSLLALKPGYLPGFIVGPAIATLFLAFVRMVIALRQAQDIGAERTLARTDELTGLPNRRKFMAELIEFSNTQGALLLLDLNGFKPINDQYGHEVGDQLLRAVSQRFRRSLPSHSTLARLGGDEFGALISGDFESTMEAALALHASASYPFTIAGETIMIGVSVGFVTNDGTRDMMHRADQAMYKAKREDLGVCQL
ncbi:MAG: GGDEF domain-containing protein [Actinobacteria bacterium]|nr:GGDEF domain-containing protein [Actinomycetota bacterium]